MAPEQARGQRVDRRADIWAFGCVLYEMLAGQKPFQGETISDVLAAVITKDPDWTAVPETTPQAIKKLCLPLPAKRSTPAIAGHWRSAHCDRRDVEGRPVGGGSGSGRPANHGCDEVRTAPCKLADRGSPGGHPWHFGWVVDERATNSSQPELVCADAGRTKRRHRTAHFA